MCANGPPIPKKIVPTSDWRQYVFRPIYRIPIGSESTLELSRQLKPVICASIFFSKKILAREFVADVLVLSEMREPLSRNKI